MTRLTPRKNARTHTEREARAGRSHDVGKRMGRVKRFLATALMAGMIFPACKTKDEPIRIPAIQQEEKVTFERAKKDPNLRQAYLDRKAKEWNNECVKSYVYDPTGKKLLAAYRKIVKESKDSRDRANFSEDMRQINITKAAVPFIKDTVGDGKKRTVYVLSRAFVGSEEKFSSTINDHEGSHACDSFRGFDIGGRTLRKEELEAVDSARMISIIGEVRAYGKQLALAGKNILERGAGDRYWYFIITNFVISFNRVMVIELRKTFRDNNVLLRQIKRPKSDLIREIKERSKNPSTEGDTTLFMLRMTIIEFEPFVAQLRNTNPGLWKRLGFDRSLINSI